MDLKRIYDSDNLLSPIERARAANELDANGYCPDDIYDFVEIPRTPYFPNFLIGKYPVTNVQYARFLKPENFINQELWLDFPKYAWPGENFQY
ncbi:MAG: hypothetical protein MUO40_05280, partial [Anaerolineaceae bacterium]|nr:hypothetical protein [Anaerolineaceae bacterium]